MVFICYTAALSGTKKDKDVQIQRPRGQGGRSSWAEVLRPSSVWLQAAGAETHCHMAINVKWAVGTKLPDKMCAWLNAALELALISAPSAKSDQMAMALWLPVLCHGGVHGAQGMLTAAEQLSCHHPNVFLHRKVPAILMVKKDKAGQNRNN